MDCSTNSMRARVSWTAEMLSQCSCFICWRPPSTDLVCNNAADLRVTMTEAIDRYARGKIQVLPILDIPEPRALAFDEHGRRSGVGRHHVWRMFIDECSAGRVGSRIGIGQGGLPLDDSELSLTSTRGHESGARTKRLTWILCCTLAARFDEAFAAVAEIARRYTFGLYEFAEAGRAAN
jgi:hypothetical protein